MGNKEILEELLTGDDENSLIKQPFMVDAFGEDIEFEVDYHTHTDTDMDRNPYQVEAIAIEIESISVRDDIESGNDTITEKIAKWAASHDVFLEGSYTIDEGVAFSFGVPDGTWKHNPTNTDDLDSIAEKQYKKFILGKIKTVEKPKVSYYEFLEIFKLGHQSKLDSGSEPIVEPIVEPVDPKVEEYRAALDEQLTEKYNVKLSDVEISNKDISENIKNNKSVMDCVSEIASKYELTPVQNNSGKVSSEDVKTSQYICDLLNAQGEVLGTYEVSNKDEAYVKLFLEAIGVKTKTGDTIKFK